MGVRISMVVDIKYRQKNNNNTAAATAHGARETRIISSTN